MTDQAARDPHRAGPPRAGWGAGPAASSGGLVEPGRVGRDREHTDCVERADRSLIKVPGRVGRGREHTDNTGRVERGPGRAGPGRAGPRAGQAPGQPRGRLAVARSMTPACWPGWPSGRTARDGHSTRPVCSQARSMTPSSMRLARWRRRSWPVMVKDREVRLFGLSLPRMRTRSASILQKRRERWWPGASGRLKIVGCGGRPRRSRERTGQRGSRPNGGRNPPG